MQKSAEKSLPRKMEKAAGFWPRISLRIMRLSLNVALVIGRFTGEKAGRVHCSREYQWSRRTLLGYWGVESPSRVRRVETLKLLPDKMLSVSTRCTRLAIPLPSARAEYAYNISLTRAINSSFFFHL